jgi:competence protein ComEC
MMLYSLGFQLSYLAVIGIVLIQSKIVALLTVKKRIPKYFWELITVSIAAQIATSPLAIHYFHQFPNYFILANLIACPISVLIIPLGFLILVIALVSSVVAGFLGKVLSLVIWILNQGVSIVEQLPLSVWQDLDWSKLEMIMAYFAIGFLLTAIYKQRKTPVWAGLACLVIMVGSMFFREVNAVFSVF